MNPLEIMAKATRIDDEFDGIKTSAEETAKVDAAKRQVEAMFHWCQLPQTKMIITTLNDYMLRKAIGTCLTSANVPNVSVELLRNNMAEVALLHKLITETFVTGKLELNN